MQNYTYISLFGNGSSFIWPFILETKNWPKLATLFTCLPKFFFHSLMLSHLSILNQMKISIVDLGLTFNVEFENQTHGFSCVHLTFVVSIVFFKNRFYFQYPFIWESFDFYSMVWSERVLSRTQNYRMTSFANPWDLEQENIVKESIKVEIRHFLRHFLTV